MPKNSARRLAAAAEGSMDAIIQTAEDE